MRRIIAISLALLALLSLTACGQKSEAAQTVGGWTLTEDGAIDETAQAAFDNAMETLLGVNYTPVALLGTQVVSGTNYCFLCEAAVVSPDAQPYYAVVKVYEDLEGKTEILEIASMTPYGEVDENAGTAEAMPGSWTVPEDDEAGFAAFEKAAEGLVGASHTPIRVLGTQLVSGNNYCLLCRSIGVYPGAEPYYTLIMVYEKLSGEAEITDIVDLDASGLPVA